MIALPVPVTPSEIAALLHLEAPPSTTLLTHIAPLESAGPTCLSFLQDRRKPTTRPGLLLSRGPVDEITTLQVEDPLVALSKLLQKWFPEPRPQWKTSPSGAMIADSAEVHPSVELFPGVVVGSDCKIGEGTVLFPRVVLYHGVQIGRFCRLHAGTVIGSDGFRYHPHAGGILKVPQVGGVRVGDGVEIGANCTIDRGFLSDTQIGDGCKLDNLVHVGHNVRLGRGVIIAAQSGLSGSCVVGDGVLVGGQVGFADHTEVGAGAKIGAQSGLHGKIPAGETWLGTPAQPISVMRRVYGILPELPAMWRQLRKDG